MRKLSPQVVIHEAGQAPTGLPVNCLCLPIVRDQAFGDGSHPTTRLCAGAVDFLCRQGPLASFLDVGTGTGILARIARARGVKVVVATDIDPVALKSAERHSALDQTSDSNSLTRIQITDLPPDELGRRFEMIVANILEAPLRSLAPALSRTLALNGILLISGFTPPQVPALRIVFEAVGLRLESKSTLEDWALLTFRNN